MVTKNEPDIWAVPQNFHSIPSAVNGITVFAPNQETKPANTPTEFSCPRCGAPTQYNIQAGGVSCEHCGFSLTPETKKVGTAARENEFTLETINLSTQGWGQTRKEIHCNHCGASISIPENEVTATCSFCGSNQVDIRIAPSENLRPRYLIPFTVQPAQTQEISRAWLGRGWYHPQELASSAVIDKFKGIYLSFWTFDTKISANWKAEVGHERTEQYYDSGSKSWQTRIVIDWRWEKGHVITPIDDMIRPGNSKISKLILDQVSPFNLKDLVEYKPDFLAGWNAQTYDIPLTAAWEEGKNLMREIAKKDCYADISSPHVRNFSMVADFEDETWRYVLLPVYLAAYSFEGQIYQVMVNGQTGKIAGQKPVAWWKIWLAIGALMLPGLLTSMVSLPLLAVGGVGILTGFVGLILLIIGIILSITLYRKAESSEAA